MRRVPVPKKGSAVAQGQYLPRVRQLHDFDSEDTAQRLADALFAEGMPAQVRSARDGSFSVWVEDDAHLDKAKLALELYLRDPQDPRFSSLERAAKEKRKALAEKEKKSRHKVMRAREAFEKPAVGWLTALLIGASVIVTMVSEFGDSPVTRQLDFAILLATPTGLFDPLMSLRYTYLEEYQLWRLFTPMFLHLSLMHLIFNMWWLKDLGTAIEHQESPWKLLALVVVANLVASFAEYFIGSPRFGGFSGVVYALFGYLWLRGRYDPTYPLKMPRSTVIWMLAWFVLCFTNFIPVANTAHGAGLLVGVVWGFIASGYLRRRFLRTD